MKIFTQQQIGSLGATLAEVPDRYQSIQVADAGIRITLPMDQAVSEKTQEAIAKRVIDVVRQAVAIGRVSVDHNLSASGKSNMLRALEAETAKLAARLDADAKVIDDADFLAKLAEEELFRPDAIEPGDLNTALDDASVRTFWAAQDAQGLEKHIAAGVLTSRHLEALKRSLIPLGEPMQTIVESQWESHLMTNQAKRFEKVMDGRSDATWGVAAVSQLRGAVARLASRATEAA